MDGITGEGKVRNAVMGRIRGIVAIVAAVSLFLPGCWWLGGEPKGMPGKTFGVYNAFPEHPVYLKNGAPGFARESGDIQSLCLKPQITEAAVAFLEAKGYRAVGVDDPSALRVGAVDILIEVLPRNVGGIPGAAGYGFSDRELPWGKPPAGSFVSLEISMKRKHSPRVIKTRPEERFSQLEASRLPDTWEGLSKGEKGSFERNLRENTAKAVYLSLSRLEI